MSSARLEAGALIGGRYRLEQPLGEGGMAVVWEATHTVTRRVVAMKFLQDTLVQKQELRMRFLIEASAASALQHPNVVEILDVFDADNQMPVMVMERLRGETLGKKLEREERLSLEETAGLILPLISAVGTAHSLGIVHRDLKPENVFLVAGEGGPLVKVLDFGIAKLTAGHHASHGAPEVRTMTGSMLGTPCYMAPEQATGEATIDHGADVWSIGVMLYECLSGTRPIEGDNLAQVVARLMTAGIIPLERLAPDLPHEVASSVMQMLVRDPAKRLRDLGGVSRLLELHTRVRAPAFGSPVTTAPESTLPSLRPRTVSSPPDPRGPTMLSPMSPLAPSSLTLATGRRLELAKKRPLSLVFGALVVAGLTGATLWLLRGGANGAPPVAATVSAVPEALLPAAPADAGLDQPPAEAAPPPPSATAAGKDPIKTRPIRVSRPHRPDRPPAAEPTSPPVSVTTPKATADEGKLFGGRK